MLRTCIALFVCLALLPAAPAAAETIDDHKMHYPQDGDYSNYGMAVNAVTPIRLADDFQCSESGPITTIHVDVSWRNDIFADTDTLAGVELAIRSSGSVPGDELWSRWFGTEKFDLWTLGNNPNYLRWFDPVTEETVANSHIAVNRLSFEIDPDDAFQQTAGEHYWLGVSLLMEEGASDEVGWSNTGDTRDEQDRVWGNGAVWWDEDDETWHRLEYPAGHSWAGDKMDMGFVIVPEPATITLLAAGALAVLLRRGR